MVGLHSASSLSDNALNLNLPKCGTFLLAFQVLVSLVLTLRVQGLGFWGAGFRVTLVGDLGLLSGRAPTFETVPDRIATVETKNPA